MVTLYTKACACMLPLHSKSQKLVMFIQHETTACVELILISFY